MKTKYLLPNRYKRIGWFLFVPAMVLGIVTYIYDWEPTFFDVPVWGYTGSEEFMGKTDFFHVLDNNILNELLGILIIVGGLFVAFSKEIDEDELITTLRLESLMWATYCNYAVLLLAFIGMYDLAFFHVMVFNMFTILVLFIIKFNWGQYKLRKALMHEE